jgi:two-component system sensor histidine kinase/response regulator
MNSLQFLLVDSDPGQSDRITSVLAGASHTVLRTDGLAQASDVLLVEHFDAVLLGSGFPVEALTAFTAKLRQVEQKERSRSRIPVLLFAAESTESVAPLGAAAACDGYLQEPLDAEALTDAVTSLAQAVRGAAQEPVPVVVPAALNNLPVFEPAKFEEQVCNDPELMVEIIDLFLQECTGQIEEMRASIASRDYAGLSRMAHTIKGSLASLHAARARQRAQELETAAGREDGQEVCAQLFAALERDLATLEPELLALRALTA